MAIDFFPFTTWIKNKNFPQTIQSEMTVSSKFSFALWNFCKQMKKMRGQTDRKIGLNLFFQSTENYIDDICIVLTDSILFFSVS